jgi:hypothetical protein
VVKDARIVGSNTLQLNEATVIRAVQEYLDAMTVTPGRMGRVTAVRSSTSETGLTRIFEVEVDGQPITAENP